MNFDLKFSLVQGALRCIEKDIGPFKDINQYLGNEIKIIRIVQTVDELLDSEEANKNDYRKINLLFILNTDLVVRDKLADSNCCGHLIGCIPLLSKYLLIALVTNLNWVEYFCEAVIQCPEFLSVEILGIAISKLKHEYVDLYGALNFVTELLRSTFSKLIFLEVKGGTLKCIELKYYTAFQTLLEFFTEKAAANLINRKPSELEQYAGCALMSLLSLLRICSQQLQHLQDAKGCTDVEVLEMYQIILSYDYSEWKSSEEAFDTIEDCFKLLFAKFESNILNVTSKLFISWMDFEVDGRPMQSVIRENAFETQEELKCIQTSNRIEEAKVKRLISLLETIAMKPQNEDDEISSAGIDKIITILNSGNRKPEKWMKALLNHKDLVLNPSCIDVIKGNAHCLDAELVRALLLKVLSHLDYLNEPNQLLNVKSLVLHCIKQLNLEDQADILELFVMKKGLSTVLMLDEFPLKLIEVFNKAVTHDDQDTKFYSDFIILSLQSPCDVVTKALTDSLSNPHRAKLMTDILTVLKPVCKAYMNSPESECGRVASDADKQPPGKQSNLILNAVDTIACRLQSLLEAERNNFVEMMKHLVNRFLVDGSDFINKTVFPHVFSSLRDSDWHALSSWLEFLLLFSDGRIETDICIHKATHLAMLNQILHFVRWSPNTFTMVAATVCDKTILIVNLLLQKFIATKDQLDREVRWLRNEVSRGPNAHLNHVHFARLWLHWNNKPPQVMNSQMRIILDWMTGDVNVEALKTDSIAIEVVMCELLPVMSASEWGLLACPQFDREAAVTMFLLLAKALLVLISNNVQIGTLCLDHCIRNLANIAKETLIVHVKHLRMSDIAKVFRTLIEILVQLPHEIEQARSVPLLKLLIDTLGGATKRTRKGEFLNTPEFKDIVSSISGCRNDAVREFLADKLLHDTRLLEMEDKSQLSK